ncbi:MAG: S41 family peptidase, partial [Vicinamibacterales bacterium]
MRGYRTVSAVVFTIALSALVGGLFGRSALAVDDKIPESQRTFVAALSAIQANFVSDTDSDRLVYGAIRGMLGTLDPHSSFFDPREYAAMRERQEGRYYGLGITIASIDGNITAQGVFEGSPAYRQGVRRGDIIARINGEDAKGWTTEQAMKQLRGPKGTPVNIEVRRRGYAEPIKLEVVRDEVHLLTVPAYFMLDATTGYIQMRDFGENTDREVKA